MVSSMLLHKKMEGNNVGSFYNSLLTLPAK